MNGHPCSPDDGGALSIELVTLGPLLLLVALALWQVLLVGTALTAAENAARAGSRALSRGASVAQAVDLAGESGPGWAQDRMQVEVSGTRVEVTIRTPVIAPAVPLDLLAVTRTAELPRTRAAASTTPNGR